MPHNGSDVKPTAPSEEERPLTPEEEREGEREYACGAYRLSISPLVEYARSESRDGAISAPTIAGFNPDEFEAYDTSIWPPLDIEHQITLAQAINTDRKRDKKNWAEETLCMCNVPLWLVNVIERVHMECGGSSKISQQLFLSLLAENGRINLLCAPVIQKYKSAYEAALKIDMSPEDETDFKELADGFRYALPRPNGDTRSRKRFQYRTFKLDYDNLRDAAAVLNWNDISVLAQVCIAGSLVNLPGVNAGFNTQLEQCYMGLLERMKERHRKVERFIKGLAS